MNSSLTAIITLVFSIQLLAAAPKFKAIEHDYKAKAAVVEKLDGIILTNVKIENLSLDEAISQLQKLGSPDIPNSAAINYTIRMPKSIGVPIDPDDPFAEAPPKDEKPPKKLTLITESLSFAKAVDQLCHKAGYRWAISFDDRSLPLLDISSKLE